MPRVFQRELNLTLRREREVHVFGKHVILPNSHGGKQISEDWLSPILWPTLTVETQILKGA